jgi:hypothetical protein
MSAMSAFTQNLDREDGQPYFIWDVPITVAELRRRLRHADPGVRAFWIGRVMREARYPDVWKLLSLKEVLANLRLVRRHLGARRAFWDFLIQGWARDGLLGEPP